LDYKQFKVNTHSIFHIHIPGVVHSAVSRDKDGPLEVPHSRNISVPWLPAILR